MSDFLHLYFYWPKLTYSYEFALIFRMLSMYYDVDMWGYWFQQLPQLMQLFNRDNNFPDIILAWKLEINSHYICSKYWPVQGRPLVNIHIIFFQQNIVIYVILVWLFITKIFNIKLIFLKMAGFVDLRCSCPSRSFGAAFRGSGCRRKNVAWPHFLFWSSASVFHEIYFPLCGRDGSGTVTGWAVNSRMCCEWKHGHNTERK